VNGPAADWPTSRNPLISSAFWQKQQGREGKKGTAGKTCAMNDSRQSSMADSALTDGEERPTLKTIARLAGLAVPTVSRALNDAPDIGEETKRRVKEIAKRIGYRPNRAGVRLRTGKTHVISLVLSTEHDMMNHTARLISSLAGALHGTSYHLIITPYFPTEDPMNPIRYIVESGSADGIIINQTEPRDPRVEYMLEKDFAFATHGRTDWDHPWADFDNESFGGQAVRMLAEKGRRRICLLRPPPNQSYSMHMTAGAVAEARRSGLSLTVAEGATSDSRSAEVDGVMPRYLTGPEACDGLIVPSAGATMATVSAAEACGMAVGREFDLVAKDAIPFLPRFRKEIMTVHEDIMPVGAFLARALMHRIAHPEDAPMHLLDTPQMGGS
jgi:LacI family transcriptional regulator